MSLSAGGRPEYHEREVAVWDSDLIAVVSFDRQDEGPGVGPFGWNDAYNEMYVFVVVNIAAHPQMTPLAGHLN